MSKGLLEIATNEELTDIIEIHFIEVPKLKKDSYEKDMLVAWTEFLKDPESDKVRNIEMNVNEIRSAKDELIKMSNDSEQREIYDMRSKILKDKVSALNKSRKEGREEGREEQRIENAKNLLKIGASIEMVASGIGLTIKEVEELQKNLEK
ncbi:Rpn family recombination-promoting nuclease/putative transposase [Clostridium gasigenes]|uniref:Rpn family recombination-promoting nuclease/putative transposase n=1 Tax=Clostridium gasigenes TaxID=94869 RepID=UPI001C0C19CB|nr:Rpn family recombination-promoting nuclease/putative transposase [Clostridium gasigenes]